MFRISNFKQKKSLSFSKFSRRFDEKKQHSCYFKKRGHKEEKNLKVHMKWFFIAEFERAAKIRKIAIYRFLISLPVPEL